MRAMCIHCLSLERLEPPTNIVSSQLIANPMWLQFHLVLKGQLAALCRRGRKTNLKSCSQVKPKREGLLESHVANVESPVITTRHVKVHLLQTKELLQGTIQELVVQQLTKRQKRLMCLNQLHKNRSRDYFIFIRMLFERILLFQAGAFGIAQPQVPSTFHGPSATNMTTGTMPQTIWNGLNAQASSRAKQPIIRPPHIVNPPIPSSTPPPIQPHQTVQGISHETMSAASEGTASRMF
ncbi:uncharacterized protein DS421_1g29690 [Arachis hypogaea]|nr:uncharacterized protein DS421_1g29690 [Arachis hypogaea]